LLRQNSRKLTIADKPSTEPVPQATEEWDEDEFEEAEDVNRYFLEINPEASGIKQLEALTLQQPFKEELYLTLVQRYISSGLSNCKQLALAALSEALEHAPKRRRFLEGSKLLYKI